MQGLMLPAWDRYFTDQLDSTCKLVIPSFQCGKLEGTQSLGKRLCPMAETIKRPVTDPSSDMFATDKVRGPGSLAPCQSLLATSAEHVSSDVFPEQTATHGNCKSASECAQCTHAGCPLMGRNPPVHHSAEMQRYAISGHAT